jgi:polyphosphate kinase
MTGDDTRKSASSAADRGGTPGSGPASVRPVSVRGPEINSVSQDARTVESRATDVRTDPNDLRNPALYINRELSWLEFNSRVLAEADSDSVPLFERVKFHAIFSSNLDEFFMVRVAGLKQKLTGEVEDLPADGLDAGLALARIATRVHGLLTEQATSLEQRILPQLGEQGLVILKPHELSAELLATVDENFRNEIFPILTPIVIDPGHPFPHVRNKSLNLGVMFERDGAGASAFGVVQVPAVLPRFLELGALRSASGEIRQGFVLLEDVVARHVAMIFPGMRIRGVYTFRVTRNFDLEIDEEEADDLLQEIQQELRRRERGNAVRVEVTADATPESIQKLARALKLEVDRDVYRTSGILNVADLLQILPKEARRELRDEPFSPPVVPPFRDVDDPFAVIRERDVLLHHPYESFDPVVELIAKAAEDPDVLAIKQTLYRAGGDSPIVRALARAAETGKQVTVVVELKARFDEASNIVWARTLEQAGAHVVYGVIGLKTHAKCLLIVRRERGKLRRYAHLSTGNYNSQTARLYTDVGIFTSRPGICEDVSSVFNLLTGYSAPPKWNSLVVAPLGMHEAVLGLIARETEHARAGRPSRIIAKMNSLVDEDVIEALYRASQAGVPILLLVRGISCLRPGVPGISETIEVRALIDRYLEHARIFQFSNGGREELFISSADWMPRNFFRRVEVLIPIEDPGMRARLADILQVSAQDGVKSWVLTSSGSYRRAGQLEGSGRIHDSTRPEARNVPVLRSQQRFVELTRDTIRSAEQARRKTSLFHFAEGNEPRIPVGFPKPERPHRRKRKQRDGQS